MIKAGERKVDKKQQEKLKRGLKPPNLKRQWRPTLQIHGQLSSGGVVFERGEMGQQYLSQIMLMSEEIFYVLKREDPNLLRVIINEIAALIYKQF